MPPLWFGYGWSTKSSCFALAGNAPRAVGAVADDARVAVSIRVVDDELPARRVVGSEREPEQALLTARLDEAPDVEERLCLELPCLDDTDEPALLDDVQHSARAARGGDVNRRREAVVTWTSRARRSVAPVRGRAGSDDEHHHERDGRSDEAAHRPER